ncbi:hypothetical protein ABH935_004467 [Catenulispora sp. GAS73]|uniref:hypothetical protein n=1 Tax=Catenulispora sp. GAS73 TaxID=3156269 RepID=UPI003515682F
MITALLHALGYPSNTDEDVSSRLRQWSGREDLLALLTTAGQQILGVVALAVIPYFERPGSWGRVVALVVDSRVWRSPAPADAPAPTPSTGRPDTPTGAANQPTSSRT